MNRFQLYLYQLRQMKLFSRTFKDISKVLFNNTFLFSSRFPLLQQQPKTFNQAIRIIHNEEASKYLPQKKEKEFKEKKSTKIVSLVATQQNQQEQTVNYFNQKSWKSIKDISKNTSLQFSQKVQSQSNFVGLASQLLTKAYKYSRKQKDEKPVSIQLGNFNEKEYIIELANCKIKAAQLANSRGNQINTQQLLQEAEKIVKKYPQVKITVIKGDQLLKEGFRLHHAVGRASRNQPIFVNLQWKGGNQGEEFISIVGKGLCFDAGGLNLKPTSGISGMHIDKHGACSVLSAFESAVKLNLKVNLVASLGIAENYVSSNSFRPLDIIKSRKGLTVQIGNTDAQGRLVLADAMNWVQQNYKVKTMLELSTLTGAIVIALGKQRAGLFTNSNTLAKEILQNGEQVQELLWQMPIDQYHQEMIKPKTADLTNSSGKGDGSSSQAAAFLKRFVENGVQWAHLDIAGSSGQNNIANGYGAKLLLNFLRKRQQK